LAIFVCTSTATTRQLAAKFPFLKKDPYFCSGSTTQPLRRHKVSHINFQQIKMQVLFEGGGKVLSGYILERLSRTVLKV